MLTPHVKIKKPPFPYDRPLSWSQINSFKYSPSRWYSSYILGEYSTSPEMEFGSMVDKKIQKDSNYLPEIKREKYLQYKLEAELNGIKLVGIPDALDLDNFIIRDYKTGRNKWDKKRADETGQLSMYLFLIYLKFKINPEKFKCHIDWMPTCQKDGKICFVEPFCVKTLQTKRDLANILKFGQHILGMRKQMEEYYNRQ